MSAKYVHGILSLENQPLYDTTHPDWLPTMHMGHKKGKSVDTGKYDRVQRRHAMQEMLNEIPTIVEREIEAFLVEEVESILFNIIIIKKQVDKARQYFKPSTTSTEVETLRKELSEALQTVKQLKDELALKGLPAW